ncbi:TPA: hypothetical protein ACXJQH_005956 [Pseudomonas aeruginosa]
METKGDNHRLLKNWKEQYECRYRQFLDST